MYNKIQNTLSIIVISYIDYTIKYYVHGIRRMSL